MTIRSGIRNELNNTGDIAQIIGAKDNLLEIEQSDFNCNGIAFFDCSFDGITIKGVNLKTGIKFHNSKIKWLTILNCTDEILGHNWGLVFDRCEIEHLDIKNSKLESLKIDECKKIGDISITNNVFPEISITNSIINFNLYLKKNFIESEIHFYNITFNGRIKFEENTYSTLSFIRSSLNNDASFLKEWAKTDFYLSRCSNAGAFEAKLLQSNATVTLSEVDFKNSCEILFSGIHGNEDKNNIIIVSSSFTSGILIHGDFSQNIIYKIDTFKIHSTNSLIGFVRVESFEIDNLMLHGINSNCVISFNHIEVQSFVISNYSNFSTTQFLNTSPSSNKKTSLIINNSYLGKTHFSNFDFKAFDQINIDNSVLTEITSTDVKWFEPKQLFLLHFKNSNSEISIKKKRKLKELFRQLKYAQERQGNTVQALTFKKYEYEAFQEETKSKPFKNSYQDRITLFFASINEHGTNWLRPMGVILVSTFFFTVIITMTIQGQLHFNYSLLGFKTFTKIVCEDSWNYFFQLLNPVFLLDKIYFGKNLTINTAANGFAILHRIILSVLIYQTIVAFRKYSK